jgi:hypothetical protein
VTSYAFPLFDYLTAYDVLKYVSYWREKNAICFVLSSLLSIFLTKKMDGIKQKTTFREDHRVSEIAYKRQAAYCRMFNHFQV